MNIIEIINNFIFLIGRPLQILIKRGLFKYIFFYCAVYSAVVNSAAQRTTALHYIIK